MSTQKSVFPVDFTKHLFCCDFENTRGNAPYPAGIYCDLENPRSNISNPGEIHCSSAALSIPQNRKTISPNLAKPQSTVFENRNGFIRLLADIIKPREPYRQTSQSCKGDVPVLSISPPSSNIHAKYALNAKSPVKRKVTAQTYSAKPMNNITEKPASQFPYLSPFFH